MIKIAKIIRSRRRTLAVEINREGQVIVRAPYGLSKERIEYFLASRQDWIASHVAKAADEKRAIQPLELREGAALLLWGKRRTLHLVPGENIFLTQEQLILGEQVILPKLIQYFQEELGTYLRERVPYFAGLLGLPAPQIKLSQARTRWGYCNYRNQLGFCWRLVFCPPGVIDYVIVHELCHIRNKSHNRLFWQAVEEILPDRKQREQWLKTNRRVMIVL